MITNWPIMLVCCTWLLPAAPPTLPQQLPLDSIRRLVVQHDGRWMPLDTLARDMVEGITGTEYFQGCDPVVMFLAWTIDSPGWIQEPLIPIRNAELRAELQLPADQQVFSYQQLVDHQPLQALFEGLAHRSGERKMNPLESKVSDIHEKLNQLEAIFSGAVLRLIPDPRQTDGTWASLADIRQFSSPTLQPIVQHWNKLEESFRQGHGPVFQQATQELVLALDQLPAAYRPSLNYIFTELHYNQFKPFHRAWQVLVAGAVLGAAGLLIRRRWFDLFGVLAMLGGFGLMSYGLWLRWQVAGRIPAANMYESLLFLSWGMTAFAILAMLVQRQRIVPLTASAMGALALLLADVLPLDYFVRPIVPVLLDTIWMSIHVPIIMVSYSVLALAVLFAHILVVLLAGGWRDSPWIKTIDGLHYWYMHVGALLLFAGIATGSMWAASSWGRYWGWDPKEVWSLIACLGYLAILHVRVDHEHTPRWMNVLAVVFALVLLSIITPFLIPHGARGLADLLPAILLAVATLVLMVLFVMSRGPLAAALKSIIAFWMIIMTYVGVNFVLGIGLHSYGFGTGAVVHYMTLLSSIDLGAVLLLAGICLFRSRRLAIPS
ncbi:MAG: Cytochrome c biogenesis protein CcsA [Phycisphaerae bacterium]|nr:Cytochrome c biogenesis protein CcsA [Phycisphaerae bacterium]